MTEKPQTTVSIHRTGNHVFTDQYFVSGNASFFNSGPLFEAFRGLTYLVSCGHVQNPSKEYVILKEYENE